MKTVSKKEIRGAIEESLTTVIAKFHSGAPSKDTRKFMQGVSRKLAAHIKDDVKRDPKSIAKTIKTSKNSKSKKKINKKDNKPVSE